MRIPTEHKTNQNKGLLMIRTPLLCPCSVIEVSLHPFLFVTSTKIYREVPGMIIKIRHNLSPQYSHIAVHLNWEPESQLLEAIFLAISLSVFLYP